MRVRASTVNRTDCGFRKGSPAVVRLFSGLTRPRHPILGCEYAGEIVEVGDHVTDWSVGDRVVGYNDSSFGGHAEFRVSRTDEVMVRMPANLTFEAAAPLLEGSHYALSNIRATNVTAGSHALVYGATGAIGSAAVQLLRAVGAHVTAVSRTKDLELVRSLGADRAVSYEEEDFTRMSDRFDAVFDAVGKRTFGECRQLLKPQGFYISTDLGPWAQNPVLALATRWGSGKRVLFPIPGLRQAEAEYIRDLAEAGRFTPVLDRSYRLEEIRDAYAFVESGQKVGNVPILP